MEPFSGAASVLLQKERSHGEVYNDLDSDIFNLFNVLRDPELAEKLIAMCELTPYSRQEFQLAYERTNNPLERARRTITRSTMGFGSGAATFHPTGFRSEAKRKHRTSAHVWSTYPPVLRFVCERLQGVNIENRPALDCIKYHDTDETLFYVDPPYMLSTRKLSSSKSVYQHEMTEEEHEALLNTLLGLKGKTIISGYDSELYNDALIGWEKAIKPSRISAGKGTGMRQECLWISPSSRS